ncbi:MAG TPA: M48 family metallopeptidase, partial [Burkholderiales bacterium]|nr:M48 family metallopeptidase [Burkholderiales bacterium]
EHSREQISRQMGTQMGIGLVGALLGIGELGQSVAGQVAHVTLNLPNSRQAEIEADRIGIELAARAGYDPKAAVTLWEKMGKVGGGGPPEFLSTHPSPQNRAARLAELGKQVTPLYLAAKSGNATDGDKLITFPRK